LTCQFDRRIQNALTHSGERPSPKARLNRLLTVTRHTPAPCPWEHIEPDGSNLSVEDFLSVPIVRIAAHLKRFPSAYAGLVGLTLPQWRLLSTVAHHRSIPLKQLAEISASDKALVSRTVKEMSGMGLVSTASMNSGDRSLVCRITPKGAKLVDKVIPLARERHARLLLALSKEERVRLYDILQKLQAICADID